MSDLKGKKIIQTFAGQNPPEDFEFPSISIEDIDRAVFDMFDKKINFQVKSGGETQKVPIVFASGERFALTRRKNPIRDKNNVLILPIVSILRGELDFSANQSGKGTAIAFREQENYVIKYRLNEKDRQYQNIINKLKLKNQSNVSSNNNFLTDDVNPGFKAKPNTIASRRDRFQEMSGGFINVGNLDPILGKNIYEIIELPYPEFVAITYDVIFWTQYMTQANQMMEKLMVSFEGQGEEITMKTAEGYELVAFFKPPFASSSNLDDYTESERVIKHSISLTVPGYILNPKIPGIPNLLRRHTSAPTIDFTYIDANAKIVVDNQPETFKEKVDRHVLTDVTSNTQNQLVRGESRELVEEFIVNPFTGESESRFSRVKVRNVRDGETVASAKISLSEREILRQTE